MDDTPNDMKRPHFMFPEPDLLEDLLNLYFTHHPACLPVFHEPSFRKDVASGLHHIDTSFGACLLQVCAIASRLSIDPRVYLDCKTEASAGWKYFSQTTSISRSIFRAPTLFDVQFCCLSAEYILGTSAPQAGWAVIGLGMRLAVELGYHRHRPQRPTVQSESEKRVFWILHFLDRHVSLYHGRPFCIRDEDFDVELPIDCDDEFWDTGNPDMDFKQPPGRLSRLGAFLHHLRLSTIISFALRTLYGIRKSKKAAGLTTNAMDDSISIIDSMLNSWFNAIPAHLRWEPSLDPNPYFGESAMLYMSYYMLQMLIHRPFIHKTTPQSLPSLAICTNAARSLSRLLECWMQRKLMSSFVINMAAFVAGIILIMNMRKRRVTNPAYRGQDLEDLYRCLRVLQSVESRYSVCGRLIHTLQVLADLPCSDSSSSSSPDSNGSGSGSLNNDLSSIPVMSGYVLSGREAPPDFAELDPTLFGLAPPEERWSEVDLSVFDGEAMNVWAVPPGGAGEGGDNSWIDWNGYVNANTMDIFQ
ncbi:hypothetical protein BDZ89DRAFT_357526 [Hymenopellis radicata]|nr:hypothetical protein BDZ89DRAFT_357526 [Hymenopellis radicata]